MSEHSAKLPHLFIIRAATKESFTSPKSRRSKFAPLPRNREQHARLLESQITQAITKRNQLVAEDPTAAESGGFYLEFRLINNEGTKDVIQSLEYRMGKNPIELMAVREDGEFLAATVFIPDERKDYFVNKVEEYRTKEGGKSKDKNAVPKPKHEKLITQIESVSYANVKSLFTNKVNSFPETGKTVWWEAWLIKNVEARFRQLAQNLQIQVSEHTLKFREREVVLVSATLEQMEKLITTRRYVAELRLHRETPFTFMNMSPPEQIQWVNDLKARVVKNKSDVFVCILDSGIARVHPLIEDHLDSSHCHTQHSTRGDVDRRGHGTWMSGLALYGDLTTTLQSGEVVEVNHNLESSKILPDVNSNHKDLYGYVTKEGVYRAEIANPTAKRVVCLAITEDGSGYNSEAKTGYNGKPTSWSAALDQLAFEDDETRRLVVVSAGNIWKFPHHKDDYMTLNDVEGIESPAQAWNALTVGAYSTKDTITDSTFAGWTPLAPLGDLSPTSRTSVAWENQWPVKPDVVFEGGNKACSPSGDLDVADDLWLLTTHHEPTTRSFNTIGETSAATALASRMAAQILVEYPGFWPETTRALIIHSAEWTQAMKNSVKGLSKKEKQRTLLRRYGYGVPNLQSALYSASNHLTLIVQDSLYPFDKNGSIKAKEMNVHRFPWPTQILEDLSDTPVEMRVTLSYFVEPNPGERGWGTRYSYASHGLRFDVKHAEETEAAFRRRVNKMARDGQIDTVRATSDKWRLSEAPKGSISSNVWEGTATQLAAKDAIGIYPVGGWWKEKPQLDDWRRSARYALIVSIRTPSTEVDLYTPVKTAIDILTPVPIEIEVK